MGLHCVTILEVEKVGNKIMKGSSTHKSNDIAMKCISDCFVRELGDGLSNPWHDSLTLESNDRAIK